MRIMWALGVIATCFAGLQSASGADAANKVIDFLFSEDNQIAASTLERFDATIEAKDILRNKKWLNEPLTKLDYILMNMNAHLKEENRATL